MTKVSAPALIAWFVIYSVLRLAPIDDADVFTQIRLGLEALASGGRLETDRLSYLLDGRAIENPGWLSQIVMAALYSGLGWDGLQALRAALYASALLVALSVTEPDEEPRYRSIAILGAVLLPFLAMLSNATLRPQMFAALAFSLAYRLAEARLALARSAAYMLVLGALWQNLHPSAPSGIVLLGCLFAGELSKGRAAELPRLSRFAILGAVLASSQILTPLGLAVFEISARNLEVSRTLGISEWMPVWHPLVRDSMWPFIAVLAATAVLVARSGGRLPRGALAATAIFSLLSLSSARFALFWALAACPLWRAALDIVSGDEEDRGLVPARTALVAALVLISSAGALARSLVSPLEDSKAPVRGVAALSDGLHAGRVYNYREWAGPLHLLGRPGWLTGLDGRLYLFGMEQWKAYLSEARGEVPLEVMERTYEPDAFFLHPGFHAALVSRLRSSGRWNRIHTDELSEVFVRNDGR